MKNSITATLIVLSFLSCEKKSTNIKTTDPSTSDSLMIVPESNEPIASSTFQTCYLEAIGKDSVFISLEDNLGTITGKMRYKNFEKDSSFGDIIGVKNADTLKLIYTFQSEGVTSEREIYFLQKEGKLVEAIGEYTNEGSEFKYLQPSKLKYDDNDMKQVDCKDFEKNFVIK